MDLLQLVFAFVNAPLFATFALGMFWRRTTGHGAFWGLLSGTLAAAVHQGLSLPAGAAAGVKGGYIYKLASYPSEMAQNFWTAIFAFSTCLIVSIAISLLTRPRPADDLKGLVYSLTPKPDEGAMAWYARPGTLAVAVLALTVILNFVFF
jgi:SSS family solute:Na+ symporter